VTPQTNDLIIFNPWQTLLLDHPDVDVAQFYLTLVTSTTNNHFTFEVLDSGACALVEALAISGCTKGQRVWFAKSPFGDSTQ
jgi:hypothetical protein